MFINKLPKNMFKEEKIKTKPKMVLIQLLELYLVLLDWLLPMPKLEGQIESKSKMSMKLLDF